MSLTDQPGLTIEEINQRLLEHGISPVSDPDYLAKLETLRQTEVDYSVKVPKWIKTASVDDAADYIRQAVLAGKSIDEILVELDKITDLVSAKTALKNLANAVITIRTLLEKIAAVLVIYRNYIRQG